MNVKKNSNSLIAKLFNQQGWHLEASILEDDVVVTAREFLVSRKHLQQKRFEEWVDTEINEEKPYAWHQQQIPIYEDQGIPQDLRNFLVGQFDLETRLDRKLVDILSTDRCRNFICTFMETDQYYIHYPPMVRFKLPNAPSGVVPIHQDLAYNQHLSDFMTVWVPLVDIDDDCGGVIVFEESHLNGVLDHETSGAWANKAMADISKYPAQHVIMNAGDALLFPSTLLHESAPHRSERIRYSIDFRVFRHQSDTSKSYYDPFANKVTRLN